MLFISGKNYGSFCSFLSAARLSAVVFFTIHILIIFNFSMFTRLSAFV